MGFVGSNSFLGGVVMYGERVPERFMWWREACMVYDTETGSVLYPAAGGYIAEKTVSEHVARKLNNATLAVQAVELSTCWFSKCRVCRVRNLRRLAAEFAKELDNA